MSVDPLRDELLRPPAEAWRPGPDCASIAAATSAEREQLAEAPPAGQASLDEAADDDIPF
jgi:hypothetical protein